MIPRSGLVILLTLLSFAIPAAANADLLTLTTSASPRAGAAGSVASQATSLAAEPHLDIALRPARFGACRGNPQDDTNAVGDFRL
jgi:hypothetical protein